MKRVRHKQKGKVLLNDKKIHSVQKTLIKNVVIKEVTEAFLPVFSNTDHIIPFFNRLWCMKG